MNDHVIQNIKKYLGDKAKAASAEVFDYSCKISLVQMAEKGEAVKIYNTFKKNLIIYSETLTNVLISFLCRSTAVEQNFEGDLQNFFFVFINETFN